MKLEKFGPDKVEQWVQFEANKQRLKVRSWKDKAFAPPRICHKVDNERKSNGEFATKLEAMKGNQTAPFDDIFANRLHVDDRENGESEERVLCRLRDYCYKDLLRRCFALFALSALLALAVWSNLNQTLLHLSGLNNF